ncbi:hypothetical protein [Methylorubrum thiocyanatum]|uniref:hypothetical protein n=1 Tax=Methylorubrum thiocyanatum TaxID=47958 RepID=UPI000A58F687|nr:hypothetical protein [Methylorubrum thiocyanatum]
MSDQHSMRLTSTSEDPGQRVRPGFRSFKTAVPIDYPRRWHRDILIQATLESSISAIEPGDPLYRNERIFSFFVFAGAQRRLIMATPSRLEESSRRTFPDHVLITRSYILSEPRCSTARAVWAARKLVIPVGDRLRILERLTEAEAGLTLGELANCVRSSNFEPAAAVLALVCAGQAVLEPGEALSPETIVRRRFGESTRQQDRLASALAIEAQT